MVNWRMHKMPSGEPWEEAPEFVRHLIRPFFPNRVRLQLAKILQLPEELMLADSVEIVVKAKRRKSNENG